ncbi:PLC-like phosphodiesterase, partial [Pilaira anomala]
ECNGGPSLCSQSYSNITQLITHDSYALSPNIAATQDYTIIDQLNDGVRGIKLTAVASLEDPQQINLCHTFCRVLDAGPATESLNLIATWLEQNPKEVVTIMWNN